MNDVQRMTMRTQLDMSRPCWKNIMYCRTSIAGRGVDGSRKPHSPYRISVAVDTTPDRGWKVVLFNDDVTPFDAVIFALQRAAGLSVEVAEMVAVEAHREDSAVVKRGLTEEDARIICGGLRKWSRIEGLCPGVRCDAKPDDP